MLAIAFNELRIEVVHEETHEHIVTFDTTECAVSSLSFAPDDSRLAAGMRNGWVWVWDIATSTKIAVFKHDSPIRSAQFSQDCSRLMTCAGKGTITMWDLSGTNGPVICFDASRGSTIWATAYLCVNDEHVLFFGQGWVQAKDSDLTLYDIRSGLKLADVLSDYNSKLRCAAVNSSEDILAVGTSLVSLIIMNLAERAVLQVLEAVCPASLKQVAFSKQAAMYLR
jgi:WD40 repeat protein